MSAQTQTATSARDIHGTAVYQERARRALPILVRQAIAQKPIFYSDLAAELEIKNARTLNYPLGSIGKTMIQLAEEWGEPVPPIQALVVNKATRMPGMGVGLLGSNQFSSLTSRQRQRVVDAALLDIYTFPKWDRVLGVLSLKPAPCVSTQILDAARAFRGGGESENHQAFKLFVASNPSRLGLPATARSDLEFSLPSGDRVDVFFSCAQELVACEVKSMLSDAADVTRGLFQCVKYIAVTEAFMAARGERVSVRGILALEGPFPTALTGLRNILGIEVFEGLRSERDHVQRATRDSGANQRNARAIK